MPELPEVETTCRGVRPHLEGQTIRELIVRQSKLRWPVPSDLNRQLQQQPILSIKRRAKYLLIELPNGTLIIHLGMSGSLRVLDHQIAAEKHDHIDLLLTNGQLLRYRDPRRFGAWLWWDKAIEEHQLLSHLGPEPLSDAFNSDYLKMHCAKRKSPIKQVIMDGRVVVGVGNIYASESLFLAGIRPTTAACRISKPKLEKLVQAIKTVLTNAIAQGGTTLRDFTNSEGKPGYFAQQLNVYGREGEACLKCQQLIKQKTIGQRSTFYCPQCQH